MQASLPPYQRWREPLTPPANRPTVQDHFHLTFDAMMSKLAVVRDLILTWHSYYSYINIMILSNWKKIKRTEKRIRTILIASEKEAKRSSWWALAIGGTEGGGGKLTGVRWAGPETAALYLTDQTRRRSGGVRSAWQLACPCSAHQSLVGFAEKKKIKILFQLIYCEKKNTLLAKKLNWKVVVCLSHMLCCFRYLYGL